MPPLLAYSTIPLPTILIQRGRFGTCSKFAASSTLQAKIPASDTIIIHNGQMSFFIDIQTIPFRCCLSLKLCCVCLRE
ncbi:MAG: hypothetical protein ACLTE2_12100 [Eubacteriales bacterium]